MNHSVINEAMFAKRRIAFRIICVHYTTSCRVLVCNCEKSSTCLIGYTNESDVLRSAVNAHKPFPTTLVFTKLQEIGTFFLSICTIFCLNKNFSLIMFIYVDNEPFSFAVLAYSISFGLISLYW